MPESTTRPRPRTAPDDRFRSIVRSEFDFIWRALRGLGVPAANVDDAAQQVFLVAAQKLDAITEGSERAFLFATARGIAANARRAKSRSRELADDDALAAQPDTAPDPEQLTAQKHARAVLDRILEGLPEDVRTVFVLYELEGLTMAQIAELSQLPPGTVASRLRRGREEFQAAVKRHNPGGSP
jgi:RNA polymerase sigma-70 factor (ECF subfamily)